METISQLPAAISVGTGDLLALTQGATGPGTGNSKSATVAQLLANVPSARPYARLLLQWTSGAIVINGTCYFVVSAPYAGTINSLDYKTGNGSFTADVEIAGVGVTGLSAVAISNTTFLTATATGANTFTAGALITVVVTSASGSPTDAVLELNITWG